MKIEKLPSGSYRVRKMYKGQMFSLCYDYKPTQKEVVQDMAKELDKVRQKTQRMTFDTAAMNYIDAKANVLSPSTIKEYKKTAEVFSDRFRDSLVSDITAEDIQKEINALAKTRSPKTVRNYHSFITAVLGMYAPNLTFKTTLPQPVKNEPYIPTRDDIRRILEASEGTEYYIPIRLAIHGLRRSEICALTMDDLDGDVLTVNKALVQGEDNKWVLKSTKTTDSERQVVIAEDLADLIRERGHIYEYHPAKITTYLTKLTKDLGIQHFSVHKLRHYFASSLSGIVPDADIMAAGGWSTDHVMKTVYRHAISAKTEEGKRRMAQLLNEPFISNLS